MTNLPRSCDPPDCLVSCERVFAQVTCLPHIIGGSRVEWTLYPEFKDPLPHLFRLEVAEAAVEDPAAWKAVVPTEAENVWFLTDPKQRVHGMQQWTHYRVRMRTPRGIYYSQPTSCFGALTHREWRLAQAILRAERKNFTWSGGQDGYLLKRRTSGQPCTCRDLLTGEIRNPDCDKCYGVGFTGGYYKPVDCVWARLIEQPRHAHIDPSGSRGAIDDIRVTARMLASPQVYEQDVWIDKNSDLRYLVHSFRPMVDIRGVPLVMEVELRQLPFSHLVYKISLQSPS